MGFLQEIKQASYVPLKNLFGMTMRSLIISGILGISYHLAEKSGLSLFNIVPAKDFLWQSGVSWFLGEYISFPNNKQWRKSLKEIIPEQKISKKPFSKKYFTYSLAISVPLIAITIKSDTQNLQDIVNNVAREPAYSLKTIPFITQSLIIAKTSYHFALRLLPDKFLKQNNLKKFIKASKTLMFGKTNEKFRNDQERIKNYFLSSPINYFKESKLLNQEDKALNVIFKNYFLKDKVPDPDFAQVERNGFMCSRHFNSPFELFIDLSNYSLEEKPFLQDYYYDKIKNDSSLSLSQKVLLAWYSYVTDKEDYLDLWTDVAKMAEKSKKFKKKIYKRATTEIKQLECIVGEHSVESVLLFKESDISSPVLREEYLLAKSGERVASYNKYVIKIPVFNYKTTEKVQSFTTIHPQAETLYDQINRKTKKELKTLLYRSLSFRNDLSRELSMQNQVEFEKIDLENKSSKKLISKSKLYIESRNHNIELINRLTFGKWQPGLDFHTANILEKFSLLGKIDYQNKGLLPPMFDYVNFIHNNFDKLDLSTIYFLLRESIDYYQEELTGSTQEIATLHAASLVERRDHFLQNWTSDNVGYYMRAKPYIQYVDAVLDYLNPLILSSERNHFRKQKQLIPELNNFVMNN